MNKQEQTAYDQGVKAAKDGYESVPKGMDYDLSFEWKKGWEDEKALQKIEGENMSDYTDHVDEVMHTASRYDRKQELKRQFRLMILLGRRRERRRIQKEIEAVLPKILKQ